MQQKEISIVNQRSQYTGDTSQGNIRIHQVIEADGRKFEIFTDKTGGRMVVYEDSGGKVREFDFAIKQNGHITPVPDLVGEKIKKRAGGGDNYQDINDISYSSNDGSGTKLIRNNIVIESEPMVNDSPHTTSNDQLFSRLGLEFEVARLAVKEQGLFVQRVGQLFGLDSLTR
jgi:hypothetical protein